MFAMTSGTTAARKFIPVTPQYLADYSRGWNIWGLRSSSDHPEVKLRPIVQLSSDWQEFRTEAGIPCGSVTGLTAAMQKRIIRWLYCVPACVGRIKDPAAKYYVALRLSMPRGVGMIIAANPSTLVNLARAGDQEKESLIRDLHDGTLSPRFDIPAGRPRRPASTACAAATRSGPASWKRSSAAPARSIPRDYWPAERASSATGRAAASAPICGISRTTSATTPVRDIGLIASEGRMTIPVADGTPSGVLDITTTTSSSSPKRKPTSRNPTVLAAHEVAGGRDSISSCRRRPYGLYRYHIYDLVRVTGFYNRTPLIEFLSKGAHFANITGEKLSEYHVTEAMKDVLRELNLTLDRLQRGPVLGRRTALLRPVRRSAATCPAGAGSGAGRELERALGEVNIEYAAKRESLRLGPVRLELLPTGAWAEWDRQRLARSGGTPEQYKHPCLATPSSGRALRWKRNGREGGKANGHSVQYPNSPART